MTSPEVQAHRETLVALALAALYRTAKPICGANNCNCPGAQKVRQAVKDVETALAHAHD